MTLRTSPTFGFTKRTDRHRPRRRERQFQRVSQIQHAGDGEGGGVDLLAEEAEAGDVRRQFAVAVLPLAMRLQQALMALDEQAAGAAGRVVHRHAGRRGAADLAGSVPEPRFEGRDIEHGCPILWMMGVPSTVG